MASDDEAARQAEGDEDQPRGDDAGPEGSLHPRAQDDVPGAPGDDDIDGPGPGTPDDETTGAGAPGGAAGELATGDGEDAGEAAQGAPEVEALAEEARTRLLISRLKMIGAVSIILGLILTALVTVSMVTFSDLPVQRADEEGGTLVVSVMEGGVPVQNATLVFQRLDGEVLDQRVSDASGGHTYEPAVASLRVQVRAEVGVWEQRVFVPAPRTATLSFDLATPPSVETTWVGAPEQPMGAWLLLLLPLSILAGGVALVRRRGPTIAKVGALGLIMFGVLTILNGFWILALALLALGLFAWLTIRRSGDVWKSAISPR